MASGTVTVTTETGSVYTVNPDDTIVRMSEHPVMSRRTGEASDPPNPRLTTVPGAAREMLGVTDPSLFPLVGRRWMIWNEDKDCPTITSRVTSVE